MINPLTPYMTAIKLGAAGLVLAGLLGFVWSWNARGERIERLEAWQDQVVQTVTVAAVPADEDGNRALLDPDHVVGAIQALAESLASADRTLERISDGTIAARSASDAADSALAERIERMQGHSNAAPAGSWDPWETVQ